MSDSLKKTEKDESLILSQDLDLKLKLIQSKIETLSAARWSVALFIVSFCFFIWKLDMVSDLLFDESRYVSAAVSLEQFQVNQNWSHPVLGKWLIANALELFGDNSYGRRLFSVAAGSGTVVSMFWIFHILSGSTVMSLWMAALTLLNQSLYVQSRLANLDSFMIFFAFLALALTARLMFQKTPNLKMLSMGKILKIFIPVALLWGLAMGSKWSVFIPACFWIFILISNFSLQIGRRRAVGIAGILILFFGFTYLTSQTPLLGIWHPSYGLSLEEVGPNGEMRPSSKSYKLSDFLILQQRMFAAQKSFSRVTHPFQSDWFEWPLLDRPVVYRLQKEPTLGPYLTAVIYSTNPVVLILGFICLFVCLYWTLKDKDQKAMFILAVFFSFWIYWAMIPRHTSFSYYFLPAYLTYSWAIAYVIHKNKNKLLWGFLILSLTTAVTFHYRNTMSGRPMPVVEFQKRFPKIQLPPSFLPPPPNFSN